jgi:hypothetical protein
MVQLIPVVEFEPYAYANKERRSPSVTFHQNPEAWYRYWKESLADSNITGLEPVENSWLVRAADLTQPETITKMLRVQMDDQTIETLDDLDLVGSIRGGYVLQTETRSLLPNCCVSLE